MLLENIRKTFRALQRKWNNVRDLVRATFLWKKQLATVTRSPHLKGVWQVLHTVDIPFLVIAHAGISLCGCWLD